jgi:hypothetical protein
MRGYVKLSLHIADVETGQVVWSSGPVEGAGYERWPGLLERVKGVLTNKYLWLVVVIVAALVLVYGALKRAARPR